MTSSWNPRNTFTIHDVMENRSENRSLLVHRQHDQNYVLRQLAAHIETEKLGDIAPHQRSVNSNKPSSNAVTTEKIVMMDEFCIYTDGDELNRWCVSAKNMPTAEHALRATQTPVRPVKIMASSKSEDFHAVSGLGITFIIELPRGSLWLSSCLDGNTRK